MGAKLRCPRRRRGSEAQHRVVIIGSVRVVSEPGKIRGAGWRCRQRDEDRMMQAELAVLADRCHKRLTGQLVPERDRPRSDRQHSPRDTLIQALAGVLNQRVQKPQLGCATARSPPLPAAHGRRGSAAPRARAPHHAPSAGRRDHWPLVPRSRRTGYRGSCHTAPRGLAPCRAARLVTACNEKRLQADPGDRLAGADLADHDPQRMPAIKLIVAVDHDHGGAHAFQTAGEQPEHIKCRFICPVRVVDHHNRRPASPELAPQRHRHIMRPLLPRRTSSASSPPTTSAMSSSGPSGRGVNSGSKHPTAPAPRSGGRHRTPAPAPSYRYPPHRKRA